MHGISLEVLRKYIRYEPETGDFYWIAQPNPRGPDIVGAKVGCLNALGYWQIGFRGRRLLGHRLAWLFTHGYMPKYLDHKNGKPWDNRLCNLREANQQQNLINSHQLDRGVEAHGARYRARVGARDKRVTIGSYATRKEAQDAYNAYVDKVHGDFARVNRPDECN
jgi:hypothetical protein